jgi:hypothetical protein
MKDDESGRVHYASDMVERWDGHYVRRDQFETRQPQEFVKARKDPIGLTKVRPDRVDRTLDFCQDFVGNTTVPIKKGPATHLYDVGIGEAEIGLTFCVR